MLGFWNSVQSGWRLSWVISVSISDLGAEKVEFWLGYCFVIFSSWVFGCWEKGGRMRKWFCFFYFSCLLCCFDCWGSGDFHLAAGNMEGRMRKWCFFSSKFMFLCCLLRKLRKFCERVIFFNLFHIMTDSSPQFSFSFYSYASFYQVGIVRGFWTYPMDGQFSVVLPNVSFLRKI